MSQKWQKMSKRLKMVLVVNDEIVQEQYVRMVRRDIEKVRDRWYYSYALKQKRYEVHINIPSKKEEEDKNYLTLSLDKLNFNNQKPSKNESELTDN